MRADESSESPNRRFPAGPGLRRAGSRDPRAAAACARRRRQRPDLQEHRAVPDRRVGHRGRGAGHAARTITSTRSTRRPAAAACGRRPTRGPRGPTISDSVGAAAVGAVAIAPSNPRVVWMGTGDQANARSSYSGQGRLQVDRRRRDLAAHGARPTRTTSRASSSIRRTRTSSTSRRMGHLFSRNEERGVFRTLDGGRTWKKVLYVNDGVGAIDLVINRKTPAVALRRDVRQGSPAVADRRERTRERRSTGPTTAATNGRSSAAACRPARSAASASTSIRRTRSILYALLENQNPETGRRRRATSAPPARSPPGIIGNEMYRTDDGGKTWRKVTDVNVAGGKAPYSFNQIRINPHDDKTVIVTSDSMYISRDGGKTWDIRLLPRRVRRLPLDVVGSGRQGPHHPRQRRRRERVGRRRPDRRLLPEHGRRRGLRHRRRHGRSLQRLRRPAGSRFVERAEQRPDRPHHARELGDGRPGRRHVQRRRSDRQPLGLQHARAESAGPDGSEDRRAHEHRARRAPPASRGFATTGSRRSRCRRTTRRSSTPARRCCSARSTAATPGRRSARTSRRTIPTKIGRNVPYCTITSISESPLTAGIIWVGTDDGKVQLTQNHGGAWTDLTPALTAAGAPADRWVSRVFASPHDAARRSSRRAASATTTSRRTCTRPPTTGKTWTAIKGNLPERADQRRRAGSQEPGPADRRQRHRRVRLDRRRRAAGRGSRPTCRRWRCTT